MGESLEKKASLRIRGEGGRSGGTICRTKGGKSEGGILLIVHPIWSVVVILKVVVSLIWSDRRVRKR